MKLLCTTVVDASLQWHEYFTLAGIASALGICVALYTYHKNTKANIAHTKASIVLQCLQRYLDISEYRTQAIIEHKKEIGEQYWRALVDLLWTEYHLWKNNFKYIDDSTMSIWCEVRRLDYNNSNSDILINDDNATKVSYKETWQKLIDTNYFPKKDSFRKFLDEIHESKEDVLSILNRYKK